VTDRINKNTYASVSPKQINGNDIDDDDEEECEKVDEDKEESEGEKEKVEAEQSYGDVRKMRKLLDPCLPTRAEREEHEMTHLPFRNWCAHCVKGRGVERAHSKSDAREEGALPEIHVDYCFPCGIGRSPTTMHEKACDAVGNMTVMAIREKGTVCLCLRLYPGRAHQVNLQPEGRRRFAENWGTAVPR